MDISQLLGWVDDPQQREEYLNQAKYPLFASAAPTLKDSGKGKLSLPYLAVHKLSQNSKIFEEERQIGPDCVSHGYRNTGDISRGYEISVRGEAEEWINRGATECIYGARGHCGAGMSGSRAAQLLSKVGFAIRKKYGKYDLSKYNYHLGNSWCPNNVPEEILQEIKQHCFGTASLAKTVEELRDALANGYAACECSNFLPASKRDSKGFVVQGGSGGHAKTVAGCDDTNGNMDFMIINSWGKYQTGGVPSWANDNFPDSAYMIKAEQMQRILNAGETYIISNFDGFPAQKFLDWGMGEYL